MHLQSTTEWKISCKNFHSEIVIDVTTLRTQRGNQADIQRMEPHQSQREQEAVAGSRWGWRWDEWKEKYTVTTHLCERVCMRERSHSVLNEDGSNKGRRDKPMRCNFSQFRQKAALLGGYQDCVFPPELPQTAAVWMNTSIVCERCDHLYVLTFPFLTTTVKTVTLTLALAAGVFRGDRG